VTTALDSFTGRWLNWTPIRQAFLDIGSPLDDRGAEGLPDPEDFDHYTGRVTRPGKFQGETVLTVFLYECELHGDCGPFLCSELVETFGDLVPAEHCVWIHETDTGFVYLCSGGIPEHAAYEAERDGVECSECHQVSTDVSDVTGACGACEGAFEDAQI
jgi:hypothetical protein